MLGPPIESKKNKTAHPVKEEAGQSHCVTLGLQPWIHQPYGLLAFPNPLLNSQEKKSDTSMFGLKIYL